MHDSLDNQRQFDDSEAIQAEIEEFERNNPKVVEAMRLFGMSLSAYQGALYAMQGVRYSQGNSTKTDVSVISTRG